MEEDDWEPVSAGQILVPAGMPAIAQIPIPNSGGLTLSFWTNARSHANPTMLQDVRLALKQVGLQTPDMPGKPLSTGTLFIQDAAGKRHLRLDYGVRPNGTVDYHWNQKGTSARFGIKSHQPAGRAGSMLHNFARVCRHAGRGMVVVGAAMDMVSIYQASNRPRRIAEVVGGWTGAWAGCKSIGAAGAAGGTAVLPGWGTAIGGIGGCLVGGFGGYQVGQWAGGEVYDLSEDALSWAADTVFTPVETVPLGEAPVLTEASGE